MSSLKPLRVAMYFRVSTDSQTTDNQKQDLNRYIEARGWEVVEIYEDKGKRHVHPPLPE
jgi:DNA invertase Pin-like site-specific DNA recombinase